MEAVGAVVVAILLLVAVLCAAPVAAQDPPMAGSGGMPGMANPAFAGASVGTARTAYSETMPGKHFESGAWSLMAHGFVTLNSRWDPKPRGEHDLFSTSMLMGHARRALGPGWLELEAMFSAEPTMGAEGYSLLLQTGETADGENPLIDRQHPHDLFMSLSASYTAEIEEGAWAFIYAAPVGSPALGPVPFMHRASGMANPVAPISHHFIDATHIAYGVLTGGMLTDLFQVEVSWFNGHEPDQDRWAPDPISLNSYSGRLTLTPAENWAIQGSFGDLKEPEQLHPAIDFYRATVSVAHHLPLARGAWSTTAVWGRNTRQETTMTLNEARERLPGPLFDHYVDLGSLPPDAGDDLLLLFEQKVQSAYLVESSVTWAAATGFMRFERALKDELFPPTDLRHSSFYSVTKLNLGGVYDAPLGGWLKAGIGASGAIHFLPDELAADYGDLPLSGMLFLRLTI
jgi:hypothetical protein